MQSRVFVLSVGKPYDLVPEGGTEHITGCTMYYLNTGDLTPGMYDNDTGVIGSNPIKEKMPVDFYERCMRAGLPSFADVEFGMKTSSGKMTLYVKNIVFESEKKK